MARRGRKAVVPKVPYRAPTPPPTYEVDTTRNLTSSTPGRGFALFGLTFRSRWSSPLFAGGREHTSYYSVDARVQKARVDAVVACGERVRVVEVRRLFESDGGDTHLILKLADELLISLHLQHHDSNRRPYFRDKARFVDLVDFEDGKAISRDDDEADDDEDEVTLTDNR